jgi:acetaldehyde dehydrogenase
MEAVDMAKTPAKKTKVAIIGSGNIGTDLMIKIMRLSDVLEMGAFVGIDPASDGLQRAARLGVPITAEGIDGLIAMPEFADIEMRLPHTHISATANWCWVRASA